MKVQLKKTLTIISFARVEQELQGPDSLPQSGHEAWLMQGGRGLLCDAPQGAALDGNKYKCIYLWIF